MFTKHIFHLHCSGLAAKLHDISDPLLRSFSTHELHLTLTEFEQCWIVHPLNDEPKLAALMSQGRHHGADSNCRFLCSTDVRFTVVSVNLPVHGIQAAAKDPGIANKRTQVWAARRLQRYHKDLADKIMNKMSTITTMEPLYNI